uniref:uncharacterized protein LOC109957484 isoform X2 n=1 Tax=Monopterus albus TaxID=43700 RepID=UPI0009B42491|nr:uncharacterized protein LOC109957484 isoform X2 [Monopterus albus]
MNERDRLDTADIYACPFTAELSKAVSVSLGLDTVSSPLSSTNLCSVRAFADCDPTVGNSSRGAPELEAAGNMNLEGDVLPLDDTSLRKDDFGQVCHGTQQVSCMDLLTSGDLDGAQTLTRGPVMSRFLCQESNWFINPAAELYTPSPQVDELLPLKSYSASSRLYRDTPGMWCANERAYGVRSETEKEGSGGHNLSCNYCNCGQASLGSRRECHCAWYNKGEQGGEGGMRAAMTQGYGQMERYHSAVPQEQATSAIKTERAVWMNCTDRTFRHDEMFPGVYLSERRVCQVCGDDASGCHYGAVTCGSCKVFFKRAAAGKQNHLCAGRNDCTIDKLRRKNCASCRLKRCYMLGMSLKGLGRRLKAAGQARTREEEEPPAAREPGEIGEMAWKTDFMLKPGSTAVRAKAAFPALSMSPTLRSCLSLLSILQSIEPAVVNAGHDPAQPDSPVALLSSLNELGERQLVAMVRWAKAIPDCEAVAPVHLRSVHPSSVHADTCQIPRDDLGDCERSCAQGRHRHGQDHSFPQCSQRDESLVTGAPAPSPLTISDKTKLAREGFMR